MRHISKGVRLAAALMALLLPASFAVSAETAQAQRIYTVVSQGNSGQIFKEPQESTFWESPVLRAGEAREDGILRFVNEDKAAVDVWIRAVELPYDDEEALAYLSALRLRITDGETVLYDGPYTRAADEGGIRLRQDAWPEAPRRNTGWRCTAISPIPASRFPAWWTGMCRRPPA